MGMRLMTEIAIRVTEAAVEDAGRPRPPCRRCRGARIRFIAFRAFDAHGDRAGVLAFRISGTADEFTKRPCFSPAVAQSAHFHPAAHRAHGDARTLGTSRARCFAVRVSREARNVRSARLDGHLLAAIVAILSLGFAAGLFVMLGERSW